MELINTHCHSKYCGHGAGEVEEYAAAAEAAGITTLAFTEHYPLSPAFDPDEYLSVTPANLPRYLDAVDQARRDHPKLEIVCGVEMDYLGDTEDRSITSSDLEPFALILGSVHFIDGWAFDDPAQRGRWEEPGAPDAIWRRYFELWCAAAADTRQPFHVMSHPDLAKKFGYYPRYDVAPLYAQAAKAARAGERMVEVNTSGSYYACAEMFPAPDLLRQFCRAGIPCTVGTDAHDPANVARDIERAYRLMYEAGYREVTVPTATGDRRTIAIE
ncbi:MAG: histidinol-phosphatase HisJ family protein [Eggerthellaceae bacterium]|nr:histidinol-phosphatase HisJ family protein [Eggerthellaceae bacterium]